jgi:CspA family cold shock protein
MASGTVKWYRKTTGYGLITPDDGSEDIFVHFSAIANKKLSVLVKDQHVAFDVKNGPTGPLAINVQSLSL